MRSVEGQCIMRLWARRKHMLPQYLILLCSFIVMPLIGTRSFFLPGLLGGDSRFPVALITVIPLSLLMSHVFSDNTDFERTSVVPLPLMTLVHLTVIYCIAAVLSLVSSVVLGPGVWVYLRALIGLVSLGLIAGMLWGERVSVVVPALFFCLASFVGTDPYTYQPLWWNFLLADYDNLATFILVTVLMGMSMCMILFTGTKMRRPASR